MLVIFWFSAQSSPPTVPNRLGDLVLKKGAHTLSYAVLALCYVWGVGDWHKRWVALLLAVAYAASDEYHQSWTPGRTPSVVDVGIDTVGAALGLWVIAPNALRLLQKQLKVRLIVAPQEPPHSTP
jgi:VanZ family protein